jgi:hypothetical protein
MKNLILIFTLLLLVACEAPTINKKADLPIEVVSLKESNKYDTLLTIPTEDKTYIFDSNKNYQGSMYNEQSKFTAFIFGLIIGALIVIWIIEMIN